MGQRLNGEIRGLLISLNYLAEELVRRWNSHLATLNVCGTIDTNGGRSSRMAPMELSGESRSQKVNPSEIQKLLDWFTRAIQKAGNQIQLKAQDVIGSAEVLLREVDRDRQKAGNGTI